jgi:alkanesulfonate monooxygenase SsuD/methylene tetrahydromethanopterin reductase-like flavin-dependent oxidoreductase (luciferase family)
VRSTAASLPGRTRLFENPAGRTERDIVHEQLTLMRAAETYGFDSVWPAEHHFTEYGYCASPALSLAALALETRRVRLGTGVVVLPLNHPLRVAEDFALLDLMSDGRVDLGVGRGYQPLEFTRYGVDQTRTREMFHEAVEVIRRAWTEETVTFHGAHYRFEGVPVRPRPLQRPHPPIWMAGGVLRGADRYRPVLSGPRRGPRRRRSSRRSGSRCAP